jgi:hypothetical protein
MKQKTTNNELAETKAGAGCLRMRQRLRLQQPAKPEQRSGGDFSDRGICNPAHARRPDHKASQCNPLGYVQ